jgi:hypothetical protein
MSNLQEFHHAPDAPDVKSRTVVAIVIAVVMAAFGIYVYEILESCAAPAGHRHPARAE